MAVAPMKYLNVYGPEKQLAKTLGVLARSELFAPEEDEAIHSALKESQNEYEPLLTKAKGLLKDMGRSSLAADYIGSEEAYSIEYASDYLERFALEVADISRRKTDIENRLAMQEKTVGLLSHMKSLDIDIDELFSLQYLKVRVGRLPKDSYPRLSYYVDKGFNFATYFNFIVYDFDGEYYWGLYFAPREASDEIDDIFQSLYFERLWVPEFVHGRPEAALEAIRGEEEALRNELSEIVKPEGVAEREQVTEIENVTAWLSYMNQLHEMNKYATVFNRTFYISGFVLENDYNRLQTLIENIGSVQIKEAGASQELPAKPPVVVKNNRFSRPYQMFTEMYGLPGYRELDPTLMISIVYSMAYGLMFADLGQGLVLGLIAYFYMWKKKQMQMGLILVRCSIFCCLFGFLFGSIFGFEHALDPMWHAFGLAEKPIEVMQAESIQSILIVSLGFGALVVVVSILTNIVQQIKTNHPGNALVSKNGLAGLVFYICILLLALDTLVLNMGFSTHPLYIIVFLVLPLLLIWVSEPLSEVIDGHGLHIKNPVDILVSGFFELFEALLGYLSNTVSFLRVGGLILVHAGMMLVVMSLAEMMGSVGMYIVVVVVGNIFVIAMEGLIVGIQALRLNYYEVFSRFYSPTGKKFVPLQLQSDSVRI